MKYFNNCKDLIEAKTLFRKLMMQHHPDRGGSVETAQAISAEYDQVLSKGIKDMPSEDFKNEGNEKAFWESREEMTETEAKVKAAIMAVLYLEGVEIELIGSWVWLSGDTRPHKETIKAAGYFWMGKKKQWVFKGKVSKGRGTFSLDDMRERHGSQNINAKKKQGLHNKKTSMIAA